VKSATYAEIAGPAMVPTTWTTLASTSTPTSDRACIVSESPRTEAASATRARRKTRRRPTRSVSRPANGTISSDTTPVSATRRPIST
jgi:hypothetical protein